MTRKAVFQKGHVFEYFGGVNTLPPFATVKVEDEVFRVENAAEVGLFFNGLLSAVAQQDFNIVEQNRGLVVDFEAADRTLQQNQPYFEHVDGSFDLNVVGSAIRIRPFGPNFGVVGLEKTQLLNIYLGF